MTIHPGALNSLEAEGLVAIHYDTTNQKRVDNVMEAWKKFCALPHEVKIRFDYGKDVAVGSGVGYEYKPGGPGQDAKEDFHVRASKREELLAMARKVHPVAVDFILQALSLNTHLLGLVKPFARTHQGQHGLPHFERDVEKAITLWTLRFLRYLPSGEPERTIALPHIDKGGFTLHLRESNAGLERLSFNADPAQRVWMPVEVRADETVIFSGARLQLRSENGLKATCHRVVSNEITAREGRYSAVAFIDFLNTPYFDKDRFGRLQDFDPPWFNYDMPFHEYEKLFVKSSTKGY